MSEIKVDKVKGRQAAASGPEVTFDSTGNISFGGNIASTGDVTADDVTINSVLLIPRYTTSALPSSGQTIGSIVYDTDDGVMKVWDGTEWRNVGKGAGITGSGGSVSTSGNYTVHTFTSGGTLTIDGEGTIDVLLVGGGAGGGTRNAGPGSGGTDGGSGGGAGGWVQVAAMPITTGSYPVSVGGGGTGYQSGQNPGTPGSNSTFNGLVAYGGGYGASGPGNRPGGPGGSGGGAGHASPSCTIGLGNKPPVSPSQGNNGSRCTYTIYTHSRWSWRWSWRSRHSRIK